MKRSFNPRGVVTHGLRNTALASFTNVPIQVAYNRMVWILGASMMSTILQIAFPACLGQHWDVGGDNSLTRRQKQALADDFQVETSQLDDRQEAKDQSGQAQRQKRYPCLQNILLTQQNQHPAVPNVE